ncbi:hypothetical protein BLOT_007851 [Blomia tropicalis]|nr:hypothetical protein BLOT_007851 [Blomia tropicalis]
METKICTPLLRWSLTPIDKRIRNVLILIWNILFFLTIIYIVTMLDPYSVNETAIELDQHYKPLLSTAIRFNMIYMYACIHIIYWSLFMLHGRKIVQLLDCESLQSIYCDQRRKPVIIFVCFLIINHGYFFLETMNDIISLFNNEIDNTIILFIQIIGSYRILHYYKYGILQLLIKLNDNIINQIQTQQITEQVTY